MAAQACSKTQFIETATTVRTREVLSIEGTTESTAQETITTHIDAWWSREIIENSSYSIAVSEDVTSESVLGITDRVIEVTSTIYENSAAQKITTATAECITNTTEDAFVDVVASLTVSLAYADSITEAVESVVSINGTHATSTTSTIETTNLESIVSAESITNTNDTAGHDVISYAETITNTTESVTNSREVSAESITNTIETVSFTKTSSIVHGAICATISTATATVSSSSVSTQEVVSTVVFTDYAWSVDNHNGFMARISVWAHSTHTYERVDWAYSNEMGYSTQTVAMTGKSMKNVVLLPTIPFQDDDRQSRNRLEAMWINEGANKGTTVHDGKYERTAMYRNGAVRFKFGKGGDKSSWDIEVRNFDYLQHLNIQFNELSRRI